MHSIDQTGTVSETSLQEVLAQAPYTLLYFYPKNDTPGCTIEAQDFTRLNKEIQKHNIHIVGVSKDAPQSHCDFISTYALTPLYISDEDLSLHKQFGARGEKNNYGKIVEGVIRSTFLLDAAGSIIKERKNIKATGHADRVLAWIEKESLGKIS